MHEGSRKVKQIEKAVIGYEPARAIDTSGSVSDAAREFRRLKIKYFYHNGLEYNHHGITYVDNRLFAQLNSKLLASTLRAGF